MWLAVLTVSYWLRMRPWMWTLEQIILVFCFSTDCSSFYFPLDGSITQCLTERYSIIQCLCLKLRDFGKSLNDKAVLCCMWSVKGCSRRVCSAWALASVPWRVWSRGWTGVRRWISSRRLRSAPWPACWSCTWESFLRALCTPLSTARSFSCITVSNTFSLDHNWTVAELPSSSSLHTETVVWLMSLKKKNPEEQQVCHILCFPKCLLINQERNTEWYRIWCCKEIIDNKLVLSHFRHMYLMLGRIRQMITYHKWSFITDMTAAANSNRFTSLSLFFISI